LFIVYLPEFVSVEDNQDAQRQWLGEGPWFDLIKKTSTASRVKLKSVV
jgi:hypothetical protein